MRRKEALFGVFCGVVGAVLTMMVCSLLPLRAQSQAGIFGEIICTGLKVMTSEGREIVTLGADDDGGLIWVHGKQGSVNVGTDDGGGSVAVYGGEYSMGVGGIFGVSKDGGFVEVWGAKSTTFGGKVKISVNEYGGRLSAFGKDNAGEQVAITTSEHGGFVDVYGKDGKTKGGMGVNERGGFVELYGDGESRATMGVEENGGFVYVVGRGGKSAASMGNEEHGGFVRADSRDGESRATMGTSEDSAAVLVIGKGGKVNVLIPE